MSRSVPSEIRELVGTEINGYTLTNFIDAGKIGSVFKAVRENPHDELACKIIPKSKLRPGWELEIAKVTRLRTVPGVVAYHAHGFGETKTGLEFAWILWDYIRGLSLRRMLRTNEVSLDLEFAVAVIRRTLAVLHACREVGIAHGDLHEGNILIKRPDSRLIDDQPTIWISDFGLGGSQNDLEPKDDYRQLHSIGSHLLHLLDPASMGARDRILAPLLESLLRKIIDVETTEGQYVHNPQELYHQLEAYVKKAAIDSEAVDGDETSADPGDYLSGESLGHRASEWRTLFVPDFPAAHELLRRNTTVLTGARGCGKTMAFRRLTALMDAVCEERSGVPGADQFIGFYLNCRDLAEAFPWLPKKLQLGAQKQMIHFFHLAWLAEILRAIARCEESPLFKSQSIERAPWSMLWLDKLMQRLFPGEYAPLPSGAKTLGHARAFIEVQKESCRTVDLGTQKAWPLGQVNLLDIIHEALSENISWIGDRPLYFFLDDYTIPIVMPQVQEVLNPIVFSRRSNVFFKVSTESSVSFNLSGLRGKPLELHHDFELVDLATESLQQSPKERKELLERIFAPRIERHPALRNRHLNLDGLLGTTPASWNEMATQFRDNPRESRASYSGASVFVGMWSSDTRSMIKIFVELLRAANGNLEEKVLRGPMEEAAPVIPPAIQNRVFRSAGGEFVAFIDTAKDPSQWYAASPRSDLQGSISMNYGSHLKTVVEAFVAVSRYEMCEGRLVGNQEVASPRQAFRLEIADRFELPENAHHVLEGLVRWHIFLQDWRGKSIRGMVVPRLFLNRVMLPFFNLTFSTHDNITMTCSDLTRLLGDPGSFLAYWRRKRRAESAEKRLADIHIDSLLPPEEEVS